MLTRFGVIGDIHTEHELLQSCLAFLGKQHVADALAVGDIADGPGDFNACCSILRERSIPTVRGNHDRWLIEGSIHGLKDQSSLDELTEDNQIWYRRVPVIVEFDTDLGKLLLCHGIERNDMATVRDDDYGYALESNDDLQDLLRYQRYRVMICGHSHRRMIRRFGKLVIINAGALHDGFAIVDLPGRSVDFFTFKEGTVSPLQTNVF